MITFERATLAAARPLIEAMVPDQWAETGDRDIPCDPNWAVYEALEVRGVLLLLLARKGDRIIGYLAGMAHPHTNSKGTLVGTISTFYVEKCDSRVFVLKSMLQAAMGLFRKVGVMKIYIETEANHSAARLLEAMHMKPTKLTFGISVADIKQEAVNA